MPDAHHVSTKVTSHLLLTLDRQPYTERPDWHAFGLDEAELRRTDAWLSWPTYTNFLCALAGSRDAAPARHEEVGAALMGATVHTGFRHMGTLFGGVRSMFELVYGWILPTEMVVVRSTLTDVAPGRLVIELELEEGLDGTVFFHGILGTMRRLPRVVNQPDAHVEAEIEAGRARYTIALGPSTSLRGRIVRAWSALTDVRELDEAMEGLRQSVQATMAQLHEANARLLVSESRWRALAEHIPGVVLVLGPDGVVESLHGAAPTREELVGRPLLDVVPDKSRAEVADLLEAVLGEGRWSQIELPIADEREPERWWSCRAAPLPGEPPRAVLLALDVTSARQAELELRQSEQRLLQAQKLEAIGRLAGGLAHDFNNVLAAVRGQAEMLALAHGADTEVRASTEAILASVDRASALTRRLLAFGRPQHAEPRIVDLSAVVRDAETLLRRLIGADITLEVAAEVPLPVAVDPTQLQQVLLNLAINARDAMPRGGALSIRTARAEDAAELLVRDQGEGMSPEVLQHLFEPFYTTKAPGRGTGLGLATVYWIVDHAGGSVEVDSEPGAGATIRVRLPLSTEAPSPPPTPARRLQPVGGQGQLVWVVEDEPEVRHLVQQMLEAANYQVHTFPDGRAALDAVGCPDLLLTDIVMPGPSGLAVAEEMLRRHAQLPVLLMSGYTDEDPEALASLTTRHGFLRKPFSMAQLLAAVHGLLDATSEHALA